jgi:hypothetical protein
MTDTGIIWMTAIEALRMRVILALRMTVTEGPRMTASEAQFHRMTGLYPYCKIYK